MTNALRSEVERYPWYHTLELGDDIVTDGMFDHRPVVSRYLLPDDLSGSRCLDVGTMDGFWAFEMERRGADEVVAADIADPEALDWPASVRSQPKLLDETKAERFAIARRALSSRVRRVEVSVYELDPQQLGSFDLVFCGDLLLHLKDPITALERIRSVSADSAIVCNPVIRVRFAQRKPLAKFDGIDGFAWWITNLSGLVRLVRAAGFPYVEAGKPFGLAYAAGGEKWERGVVRGYVKP
jgi:tRNA (mo5U34)-methyltransferase